MRVYGLNSRRPTSPVAGEGERGRQVSSALPGSLARLTGPCAEGFPGLPEDATAAGVVPGARWVSGAVVAGIAVQCSSGYWCSSSGWQRHKQ